jgi:hypothetical protein
VIERGTKQDVQNRPLRRRSQRQQHNLIKQQWWVAEARGFCLWVVCHVQLGAYDNPHKALALAAFLSHPRHQCLGCSPILIVIVTALP